MSKGDNGHLYFSVRVHFAIGSKKLWNGPGKPTCGRKVNKQILYRKASTAKLVTKFRVRTRYLHSFDAYSNWNIVWLLSKSMAH